SRLCHIVRHDLAQCVDGLGNQLPDLLCCHSHKRRLEVRVIRPSVQRPGGDLQFLGNLHLALSLIQEGDCLKMFRCQFHAITPPNMEQGQRVLRYHPRPVSERKNKQVDTLSPASSFYHNVKRKSTPDLQFFAIVALVMISPRGSPAAACRPCSCCICFAVLRKKVQKISEH